MLAIGCDVGGTNTRSALIDLSTGKIVARRKSPSRVGDYFVAYAGIARDVRELQAEAGQKLPVGVALAGQLNPTRRRVLMAPNLKWRNVSLADDLERALGVPVLLENDVRGAARGELRYGALKGVNTGACVFWGSGIGGAIVAGGEVIVGPQAIAGEIGHMTFVPGGLKCGCGKLGCFEAYAGGNLIHARTKRSTHDWIQLAKKGDRKARKIMDDAVLTTACLIANLVNALDPEKIVLGGGLGLAQYSAVKAAMKPMVLKVRKGIPLTRPRLGDDAGILGAATLFDKVKPVR